VLPIFINDGATLINIPQVAIHLTQEEAVPGGEGAVMGSAIEVRVSSDPAFKDTAWQQWESLIPFTFDATPGLKTVYVQFRDGGGRTAIATASIQYDPKSTPQVVPIAPGALVTPAQQTESTPDVSPTPIATIADATVAPVPTIQPAPATTSMTGAGVTPRPTVTAIVLVITPQGTAVFNPTPRILPTSEAHTLVDRPDAVLPEWLLPGYLIVQGAVIVVGIMFFFRTKAQKEE
jgi:hypothetical protein